MKRLHVHISTDDLVSAKQFYSGLFGQSPAVEKPDYMKWMLDDPQLNFAVSQREGAAPGVNHLGIQVDSDEALEAVNASLLSAEQATRAEPDAQCCYANSNKHWARDPQGVVWEVFHTMGAAETYGQDLQGEIPQAPAQPKGGCC